MRPENTDRVKPIPPSNHTPVGTASGLGAPGKDLAPDPDPHPAKDPIPDTPPGTPKDPGGPVKAKDTAKRARSSDEK
ncbi:hypothetical protein O4H61_01950 [Roseovarius aestuarii]|nr:hypothetical protein [Roseovarius aestuarii]